MRDITLGDTFYHFFTTRAFATGVPTQLAGTPALSVLEENNATPITSGVSLSVDRATVTGLNQATIIATSGNGYESGKSYAIYISTGTVGGTSVVGEVVGEFTIQASAAAVDLANGTDGLGAIKTDTAAILVDTGTTLDGRIPAALVSGRMDCSVGAMAANVLTATAINADAITAAKVAADVSAEIADAVWDEDATGHQTGGTFGQAIGDPGADTNTIFKAVVTDATGATVGVDAAAILADTGTDGVVVAAGSKTGYSLTATTGLGNQTADITGSLSGSVGSVTGAVGSVTGNVGGSVASVTAGVTLAASAVQAIWDALTTALTTVGSIGKLLVDNINATISSRASQTSLDTLDDYVDTEVAAIKAKTDSLTFTQAGHVDANVQRINDVAITGDGSAGDKFDVV